MKRLVGLDSIRFLCALWIVVFHVKLIPPLADFHGRLVPALARPYDIVYRAARAVIEGQSAVIVFFLISGLCIHFPYRNGAPLQIGKFLARRYTRILLPLFGGILLMMAAGGDAWDFRRSILWSLICEVIYYTIYPLLLLVARRVGWGPMTAVSFVVAYVVVATFNPTALGYSEFNNELNWVVGLPCWLLGCLLAERIDRPMHVPGRWEIWAWRGLIFAGSISAQFLVFHSPFGRPIGLCWSLNLFAILVYFWLAREIRCLEVHPPPPILERAGLASYSLYLTHTAGYLIGWTAFAHVANPLVHHLLTLAALGVVCHAFYRVVERPSHRLSQGLFRTVPAAKHTP